MMVYLLEREATCSIFFFPSTYFWIFNGSWYKIVLIILNVQKICCMLEDLNEDVCMQLWSKFSIVHRWHSYNNILNFQLLLAWKVLNSVEDILKSKFNFHIDVYICSCWNTCMDVTSVEQTSELFVIFVIF